MVTNPFPEWLGEVAADKIVFAPDDINTEADGNLWSFSLTPEQAATIVPSQVEAFVREAVAARSKELAMLNSGPMIFYCWHDEMAAQLRFSLVSSIHAKLPFVRAIELVADLGSIVRAFLSSTYHVGIPWSEFKDVSHLSQTELGQLHEQSAQSRPPLRVWSQEVKIP